MERLSAVRPVRLTRPRVAGTICCVGRDDQLAGTRIRNADFEDETRAFLQLRLRLLLAILCPVFATLMAAIIVTENTLGRSLLGSAVSFVTDLPGLIITGGLVLTGTLYLLLRIKSLGYGALTALDAILLQCILVMPVVPYALYTADNLIICVVGLAIFIMTRAVLIPSTASRTFMLSMPAVLAILVISPILDVSPMSASPTSP